MIKETLYAFQKLSDDFEKKLTNGVIEAIENERETINGAIRARYDEIFADMETTSEKLLYEALEPSFSKVSGVFVDLSRQIKNISDNMSSTGNNIYGAANEIGQTLKSLESIKFEIMSVTSHICEASTQLRVAASTPNETISKSNELITSASSRFASLYTNLTIEGEKSFSSLGQNISRLFINHEEEMKNIMDLLKNLTESVEKNNNQLSAVLSELYDKLNNNNL